jgi:hypothetical protein
MWLGCSCYWLRTVQRKMIWCPVWDFSKNVNSYARSSTYNIIWFSAVCTKFNWTKWVETIDRSAISPWYIVVVALQYDWWMYTMAQPLSCRTVEIWWSIQRGSMRSDSRSILSLGNVWRTDRTASWVIHSVEPFDRPVHLDWSEAENLLLLAKEIFSNFQEAVYLKLTYLYLVSEHLFCCFKEDRIASV